jgi:hypothetical protein
VGERRTTACFGDDPKVVQISSEFQTDFMHKQNRLQLAELTGDFKVKVVIHSPYH